MLILDPILITLLYPITQSDGTDPQDVLILDPILITLLYPITQSDVMVIAIATLSFIV